MGYESMTDATAITTRAKENMLFAMASLSREDRMRLGYQQLELIKQCSFNGKQCSIVQ